MLASNQKNQIASLRPALKVRARIFYHVLHEKEPTQGGARVGALVVATALGSFGRTVRGAR
jgi:hypothetical protein